LLLPIFLNAPAILPALTLCPPLSKSDNISEELLTSERQVRASVVFPEKKVGEQDINAESSLFSGIIISLLSSVIFSIIGCVALSLLC